MTCEERKDLLLLYAAGALDDAAEREALAAHLASGCPQCAGALAEAEATVAQLPLDLSSIAPPPAARERLMQRVQEKKGHPVPFSSSRATRWGAMAMAASIGIVVGALAAYLIYAPMVNRRELALRTRLQNETTTIQHMHNMMADAQLISLEKMPPQPKARGRVYWDKDQHKWHVFVFDMMPPPPGKEYELWMITPDQKKMPAGTFMPDADGRANLVVSVPKDMGRISVAAITDEPMGGVQAPTGQVQLKGEVPTE